MNGVNDGISAFQYFSINLSPASTDGLKIVDGMALNYYLLLAALQELPVISSELCVWKYVQK